MSVNGRKRKEKKKQSPFIYLHSTQSLIFLSMKIYIQGFLLGNTMYIGGDEWQRLIFVNGKLLNDIRLDSGKEVHKLHMKLHQ